MKKTILDELLMECPFQETLDDTELMGRCPDPIPKLKVGYVRADHDGWRWYNTVWPCHNELASPEICKEIDRVYDELTAADALKDLPALCSFCKRRMEACVDKEYEDEFNFFYTGIHCDFWIRLITRKGDYNMYLNAYAKNNSYQKYFDFLEQVRQSGETNMYGAVSNLQEGFPELRYDCKRAKEILLAWFKSFDRKEDESC